MKFSEIHHWIFIIELETLQFQCEFATKAANPHDHSGEDEEIEGWVRSVKKKRVKNWFIFSFFAELPEASRIHPGFKVSEESCSNLQIKLK
jgi:hypothetical protein